MIRFLKYVSLIVAFVVISASCSKNTYLHQTGQYGIANVGAEVRKYNMNLNFRKKHFNGMLAVRQMDSTETRVVGYTAFGLSLFDFGLSEETFTVYNCIEPMQNKKLLKLLERDFKLLFLPNRTVKKVEITDEYTKFADGKFLTKSVITIKKDSSQAEQSILVEHPWLKLSIELHELKEDNVIE